MVCLLQAGSAVRDFLLKAGIKLNVFHGHRRAVGEGLQEFYFLHAWSPSRGPIISNGTDGLARPDRDHNETFHESGTISIRRNSRIDVNIFNDRRLLI